MSRFAKRFLKSSIVFIKPVSRSILGDQLRVEIAFEIMADSVESIYDGEQYYYGHETSKEEMMQFLESLSQEQFSKLENFFENLPKINKKVDMKCSKCGFDHTMNLEGLETRGPMVDVDECTSKVAVLTCPSAPVTKIRTLTHNSVTRIFPRPCPIILTDQHRSEWMRHLWAQLGCQRAEYC